MGKIYCQGKIVSQHEARISANDHGFLYGATLFETFRTYDGKPFLLQEHINRLLEGCRSYNIQPHEKLLIGRPPSFPAFHQAIQELLSLNNLPDAVFRYTLSAGEAPAGLPSAPYQNPTEIIFVRAVPPAPASPSITIHLLDTTRTEPEVFPRPKSGHYMNSLAGLREFQHRQTEPGDEGLFLTRDGRLSEGITSNIFLLSGDTLLTPSPDSHILAGITRNHILAHARSLGIQAKEESLGLCDLTDADAIFVTNSVRGLVPVRQVIDRHGKPIWQRDSTAHPLIQQFRSVTPFL